jgi:hypothetical protein
MVNCTLGQYRCVRAKVLKFKFTCVKLQLSQRLKLSRQRTPVKGGESCTSLSLTSSDLCSCESENEHRVFTMWIVCRAFWVKCKDMFDGLLQKRVIKTHGLHDTNGLSPGLKISISERTDCIDCVFGRSAHVVFLWLQYSSWKLIYPTPVLYNIVMGNWRSFDVCSIHGSWRDAAKTANWISNSMNHQSNS